MYKKTILFALVAICSLLTIDGMAQNKDQAAVGQSVDQLKQLMIDPDKSKLEALASDELSYGHSSGKLEDKKAFVDALVSGSSDFKTIDLTEQTITIVDNTAFVRHKLMAETANDGKPGTAKLAVLLVWVKQKGNWKLLARQAVKI
ncbi:nuclear transport factor 2 family protein [Spirosoma flavum]|uniref:Nuclear transport factor 2 family protein n=1 Tax=Spirosoma flavum TaxID=2048557 RepID=A0ABW6AEB3_9BACT